MPPHGGYLASHELSKTGWEGQCGDEQSHQGRKEQTPGGDTGQGVSGAALTPLPKGWEPLDTYFFMRKRLMVFWRRMNCTILRLR